MGESTMATREEITQQALALSPEDRAYIVFELERSFAEEPDRPASAAGHAEFLAELKRRSAAYRSGETKSRPAADVIADLRKIASSEQPA
jgi:putative addiction module component (TIGR02574 family)